MKGVKWMTSAQAAVHLGFVKSDGSPNLNAFLVWKHRAKPRAYRLRGSLRFREVDLDACLEPEDVAAPLRLVGGRRL